MFEISIILGFSQTVVTLLDSKLDCFTNEISMSRVLEHWDSLEMEQTDKQEVGVDGAWEGNSSVNIFHNGK